jgi:predicted metallo-beta-lactamase superfamily hydrolase
MRLVQCIDTVILDHRLIRSTAGPAWLDNLAAAAGKNVYRAADFMVRPRRLLEVDRVQLYEEMSVPQGWHDNYVRS